MIMVGAVVLQAAIVCVWAMSGEASSNAPEKGTTEVTLHASSSVMSKDGIVHTSSSVMSQNLTVQTSNDSIETPIVPQTQITPTLTKSEFENRSSTSKESVSLSNLTTSQSDVQTTVSQSSISSTQIEQRKSTSIDANHYNSTNPSMLPSSDSVHTTQPSSRTDSFSTTLLASTTIYDIELTNQLNYHKTIWLSVTSELQSLSKLSGSQLTQVSTTSWSAEQGDHSSETASQIWSSNTQSTPVVHVQTTSVTKFETAIVSSFTRTMMATSTPETPSQKPSHSETPKPKDKVKGDSADDMAQGTKIAIGVVVAVCLLGIIVAGVVVYRRYNITHRSLKSFLTSGVRYKTYNNAIYKDDEGMLIMPDTR